MTPYPRRRSGTDAYAASHALFDALITRMGEPEMLERPEHTVEEFITGTGRDVLKRILQDHLDARAAAEPRLAEVPGADEVVRRRAEPGHTRLLGTTLGGVEVTRIAYRAPGVSNLHPADARLALPGGRYSYPLQKAVVQESVTGALREARDTLARMTGQQVGTQQLMQITVDAAQDVRDFYRQHRVPAPVVRADGKPAPRDLLVLSVDATGVNMIDSGLREAAPNRDRGPQPPSAQLALGMAAHNKIISVSDQDRGVRPDFTGMRSRGLVPDSCGLFQPMERDVHDQRTDHATLGSSLFGRRERSVFEHPGFQPARDHVPGGERPERVKEPVVVDGVERRGQIGIHDPHPLTFAFQRGEQRTDRIGTATTRTKSVTLGLEPGLPLGFKCVADPALVTAVNEHGNAERAAFSIGLRYIHTPDRQRIPGGDRLVHPDRHLRPSFRGQGYLPVDPSGPAPSITLRHLAHADQRVRPGSQRHLLQRPYFRPVLLPRRLEDPLP